MKVKNAFAIEVNFDGDIFEFKEQIIEAFKKCGFSDEESKARYECLEVAQNAERKGGIPF